MTGQDTTSKAPDPLLLSGRAPAAPGSTSTGDASVGEHDRAYVELREGEMLGRYLLQEWLGSGGMGVVWSALDLQLHRSIAIKLLHQSPSCTQCLTRFLREAQAMARLCHPNVVQIYDSGWFGGHAFLTMELAGRTLRNWLTAEKRSWREILDAYLQAGRGLAAAHTAGMVHRDFKPDNVLIAPDGRVRVADLGLVCESEAARVREPVGRATAKRVPNELFALSLTAAGAAPGTMRYMSPEQHAQRPVGPASDQFSYCVALFEGLFGVLPFADTSSAELKDSVMEGRILDPPTGTRVPGWLIAAIRRGLNPRPEERHPDVNALLQALRRDPQPHGYSGFYRPYRRYFRNDRPPYNLDRQH